MRLWHKPNSGSRNTGLTGAAQIDSLLAFNQMRCAHDPTV